MAIKGNKVNRKDLLSALDKAKIGLEGKGIADIQCFTFLEDIIFCHSTRLCAIVKFDSGYNFSISAEDFYKIICNIKEDEIYLQYIQKKNKLRIKSKSKKKMIKSEIACLEGYEDHLSIYEGLSIDGDFRALPKNFKTGIDLCSFSASRDDSQFILNCLYFADKAIYSSDDLRISKFDLSKKMSKSFLIHYKCIDALKKVKLIEYRIDDTWIYFRDKTKNIYCGRLTNEDYEAEPALIDKNFKFKGKEVKLPKDDFLEAIELVSVMVEKEEGSEFSDMTVSIEDGEITIVGRKNEVGYAQTTIKTKIEENIKFRINPEFMRKILDKSDSIKIGKDRAFIEIKRFKHLISLARI